MSKEELIDALREFRRSLQARFQVDLPEEGLAPFSSVLASLRDLWGCAFDDFPLLALLLDDRKAVVVPDHKLSGG